ncbi:MAG: hypothetical protein ACP5QT_07260 [Brevinematia bacterium]
MGSISKELVKTILEKNAYHSNQLIDNSYNCVFYFRIITKKDVYKKVNLIVFVNDMQLVITGYRLFWNGELDYFIIRCENEVFYNGVLYYFELEKKDGTLEYLGKNDLTTEEWKIESFEYKPKETPIKIELKDTEIDTVYLLMDTYKTTDLSILQEIDIKNLLFEKENLKEIDGFCCKTSEGLKELFSTVKNKAKTFIIDKDFEKTCLDFFISKNIDASQLVETLGENLFSLPVNSSYFNFRYLEFNSGIESNFIPEYKLVIALQFIFIGIPLLPFSKIKSLPRDILSHLKNLIEIRKANPVLKNGEIRFVFANKDVFGFERFSNGEKLLIFFNRSDESFVMDVTKYFGNGDFIDISKEHPLKRKRQYSLYPKDFVILKKTRER